ncbi:MAG: hypothetical protein NTX25_00610, partial [Proteobacteria bacterium]|nr:hypothetical protein [Pseudomonadota bacterium]
MFIATFFLLLANSAFAAKVTKVDAEKKLVTIDEGTETNFAKGSKICFYSESDSKLGCAFIRSAKAKIAFIKIKGAKLFEKIAVGINVKLESSPDPSSSTVSENSKPEAKTKSTDT